MTRHDEHAEAGLGVDYLRQLPTELRAKLLYRIDWFDPGSSRLSGVLSNPRALGAA